jgi:hypothetical protein
MRYSLILTGLLLTGGAMAQCLADRLRGLRPWFQRGSDVPSAQLLRFHIEFPRLHRFLQRRNQNCFHHLQRAEPYGERFPVAEGGLAVHGYGE